MVQFAGYEMPLRYPDGILKEHLHVRAAVGLFDVSHMGQIEVRPIAGDNGRAAHALESVVCGDIVGLARGRQRYTLLLNENGGIRDDLMIANMGDHFIIVANASRKAQDEAYLRDALSRDCLITLQNDRALLALQGPAAENALAALLPEVRSMRFLDVHTATLLGADCVVSRSGYTGEDGFEISIPASRAETLVRNLLAGASVIMIGLGARDSLRLETGLCLYGTDLDSETTPVEADLQWAIQSTRRPGGSRVGGFPGATIIFEQLARGAPRKRVGLRPQGRAPVRQGARLFADPRSDSVIGVVTSGGFGPSVNAPVAIGYITTAAAAANRPIYADLRGERVPMTLSKLPFVATKYRR
jgi:aminomethyltransferase